MTLYRRVSPLGDIIISVRDRENTNLSIIAEKMGVTTGSLYKQTRQDAKISYYVCMKLYIYLKKMNYQEELAMLDKFIDIVKQE